MTLATCPLCPEWEVDVIGPDAARRIEDKHKDRKHPELRAAAPSPSRSSTSRDSGAWRTQALDALAQLSATRPHFTVYEVAELGVDEPPDPAHDWGFLTRDAKHLGVIAPVRNEDGTPKAVESKRPATRGSLVKVWQAGPAAAARRSA